MTGVGECVLGPPEVKTWWPLKPLEETAFWCYLRSGFKSSPRQPENIFAILLCYHYLSHRKSMRSGVGSFSSQDPSCHPQSGQILRSLLTQSRQRHAEQESIQIHAMIELLALKNDETCSIQIIVPNRGVEGVLSLLCNREAFDTSSANEPKCLEADTKCSNERHVIWFLLCLLGHCSRYQRNTSWNHLSVCAVT